MKTSSSPFSDAHLCTAAELAMVERIEGYINDESFPCVGAKAALSQGNVIFNVYSKIATPETTTSLYLDLLEYVGKLDLEDPRIQSFVAIFEDEDVSSEVDFEQRLWSHLSHLHTQDKGLQIDWNNDVSDDPESPHFSMSIANHPFFIVGMHGHANRKARRTPYPVMVFNSNLQFDKLRADGRYDRMKEIIRKREREINGDINPMLDDFGRSSEARQYSGRALPDDWKCPFSRKSQY